MPDNVSALGYWLAMLDYKGAKGVGLKAEERRELSSCGPDRRRWGRAPRSIAIGDLNCDRVLEIAVGVRTIFGGC